MQIDPYENGGSNKVTLKINVYDFDNTIFHGDSTLAFYFFCLKRHPQIAFLIPKQIWALIKYKRRKCSKTECKEAFFSFLKYVKDIDSRLDQFWDKNINRIEDWYLQKKTRNDVVISASPEFLLAVACKRLAINPPIASIVNKYTGEFMGLNCHDQEKVNRFKMAYPHICIGEFYSDSYSDLPMAIIAESAFLVSKGSLRPFPLNNSSTACSR